MNSISPAPAVSMLRSETLWIFSPKHSAYRAVTAFVLLGSILMGATVNLQASDDFAAYESPLGASNTTSYARLDTSFNSTGFRTEAFGGLDGYASSMALQPDGKILAAGRAGSSLFGLMRFNPDASLDTSFDSDGKVTTAVLAQNAIARAVVLQPDGKILVGGEARHSNGNLEFALVRYNADGSLDTSFGTGGIVTTSVLSGHDLITDLALRPDGRIIAVGASYNGTNADFVVVSYNPDGSLDNTFSGDGKVTDQLSPFGDFLTSVVVQPDGKIVAGGWSAVNGLYFALLRYNTDGTLDSTFDGDGKVATTFSSGDLSIASIVLQPDGKIIAAGGLSNNTTANHGFAVARYNSDGSLDTSFSGDGSTTALFPLSFGSSAVKAVLRPDGRILLGGWATFDQNEQNLAFARFNADGALDRSFDRDGRATINYAGNSQESASDFAFDANDGLLAVGTYTGMNPATSPKIGISRIVLDPPTELPTLFDEGGDRLADLAVYRTSNNTWYSQKENGYSFREFGVAGDKIIPADFDRDGISDIAVFRPSTGHWYFVASSTGSFNAIGGWGQTGDVPAVADLTGDGRADLAVFRPSENSWYVRTFDYVDMRLQFGSSGDVPVTGDFDGDGASDLAVYNTSNYTWRIRRSRSATTTMPWGEAGDVPVPADYDGDGATDIAVWRPSTGKWWIIGSTEGWITQWTWGESGDKPVPADYDNDGRADIAVWRPSNGTWYIVNSSNYGFFIRQFGQSGDIPTPSAFTY